MMYAITTELDTSYVYPVTMAAKCIQLWSPVTSYFDECAKKSTLQKPSQQEVLKPP